LGAGFVVLPGRIDEAEHHLVEDNVVEHFDPRLGAERFGEPAGLGAVAVDELGDPRFPEGAQGRVDGEPAGAS
jgi:hypothetical protein